MGVSLSDISKFGPGAQKQILEQLGKNQTPRKPSKYRNEKVQRTMPNGTIHTFDSIKEAEHYDQLMLALKAGQIRKLRLQVQFTLQESYISADGDRVRAIRYFADFVYEKKVCRRYVSDGGGSYEYEEEWETVVEDTKSKATKTPLYKMKKKLMHDKFGISIIEV